MPTKAKFKKINQNRQFNLFWQYRNQPPDTSADKCPYCESREVVKRGWRQKRFETVQLYRCKTCNRTFSSQIVKGKHYPLRMILDGVSLYNLGYRRSEVCLHLPTHQRNIISNDNLFDGHTFPCIYENVSFFKVPG